MKRETTPLSFHRDYQAARQAFLACAHSLPHPIKARSWTHPLSTDDCPLATDTVYFGSDSPDRILVLIAGTHGVEGYAGSAILQQSVADLCQSPSGLSADCAVLFIHGLNPWGMQAARRVDEAGIDLNRNFLEDFTALPRSDHYDRVVAALTLSDPAHRDAALGALKQEIGDKAYEIAFSSGQYCMPWAPFYGGAGPSHAYHVIEEIVDHYTLKDKELLVLDLHSGLGPYGYGDLISDHPLGSLGDLYAQSLFGPSVTRTEAGEGFSVPKHGLLDYYWHRLMVGPGAFLTLEFGTFGTKALFDTIMQDHLAYRSGKAGPIQKAKQAMMDHFCPEDPLWQEAVLDRARALIRHVYRKWRHRQ